MEEELQTPNTNPSQNDASVSIDGVIGRSQTSESRVARSARHNVKHPAASQTLMRQAVRKPQKGTNKIESLSSPLGLNSRSELIKTPVMATKIDPKLMRRANSYRTSDQVSRFGAALRSAIPTLPQNQAPTPERERLESIARPAGSQILDEALENATSHQQPRLTKKELKALKGKHPRRGHFAAVASVGVMALLVIAYAIHVNMPNIMVKVASARAGFSAVLPSYRPAGYSLTSVGYESGVIAINYKEGSTEHKFTLTEHSSNWDSATLVSSVIVPTQGTNYKKLSADGQEIYLYGNDQASWVSAGIWYQITSNGSLNTTQLIKLATTT